MKLRIRDQIRSAFLGLLVMAGSVYAFLRVWNSALSGWQRWAGLAACVIAFWVGICGVALLFRRRRGKGFVLQHTDFGDVSISMKAMENMVKRCVDSHTEFQAGQTRVYHEKNGISVEVRITLSNGMNIPLTVKALQRQIKQYISDCSGVDVHTVSVKVETDIAKLPAPHEMNLEEEPAKEEAPHPVEDSVAEMPQEPVPDEAGLFQPDDVQQPVCETDEPAEEEPAGETPEEVEAE